MVDAWQRQLWFGLRVLAVHFPGALRTDQSVVEHTLDLWRNNTLETNSKPDGTPHRINESMVRWLTRCAETGTGQLIPDDEPLWLLTGFPDDPRREGRVPSALSVTGRASSE